MMVCFICQSSMIVGPALADLAAAYLNVPYANILLISTIPQLCGIPVSLITGKIAGSKVKYKTLAATCALIGGVLPFFIRSFPIILLSRVILGLSYNISVPLTNSLPLLYFDKQKAANLMGIGATAQSVTGTLVQFLAGVVCAVNVHLTWLVHLYLAIPLIGILICLPEPEKQENAKEVQEVKKEKTEKKNYHLPIGQFVMFGLSFCVFNSLILNMSAIVTSNGLGTAAVLEKSQEVIIRKCLFWLQ